MAPLKCCVGGCSSKSTTQKLFCMPMNDNLRNLWMSFLVPVNPHLLGLTKFQLLSKRVCHKHFDKTQFDSAGVRIRYSYPCLFTEKEILHGVPLSLEEYNVLSEHNYCSSQEQEHERAPQEPTLLMGMQGDLHLQEHLYTLPVTNPPAISTNPKDEDEQPPQVQPTSRASAAVGLEPGIEGSSNPQEPLKVVDTRHVESETQTPLPSSSKGSSVPVQPVIDTQNLETKLRQMPRSICLQESSVAQEVVVNTANVDNKLCQEPRLTSSKGLPRPAIGKEKKTHCDNVENIQVQPSTSKGGIKKFNAKTRRLIKDTTKIAVESLGQTSTERLRNAQNANPDLMENLENLNKKAKAFLIMQLRLARKNKMARRFSLQDKLFALGMMKQSPKGYKFLQNIFALPTKRTLTRLSSKIVFETGINQSTFNYIKNNVKNWDEKKKLCSLVFDEVALTPHLTYNESKDIINGFVEIAGERKQKFADHALVFMIRGICSSWRQSIAYYFCSGTVSAPELEKIVKEMIPQLSEAGLKPLALVCDQGSTFRSCFKHLKATTSRLRTADEKRHDTVHVAGHDLFIFHDPPHLLKGIRNNFVDKDILFEGKRATWKDILYVYDLDMKNVHTRALPMLTADHVDPKKMKKMKVKVAAQVLSSRTAAQLNFAYTLHAHLNVPMETMKTTAALVLFVDELFDSVNGSPGQTKGKLRCAVKENSPHNGFWRDAIKKLKNIKFIDTNSKLAIRAGKPRYVSVPSLEGWITTLHSFLGLSKLLFSKYNIEYFYPRLINQDPLENFFGRVRAMNFRNVNPDASQFIYSFKSLVIANILSPQSKFANCEDDHGENLIDLNYLFTSADDNKENEENMELNSNTTPSSSSLTQNPKGCHIDKEAVMYEKIKVQTSAYTAGYMCRKMTKKFNCEGCKKTYTAKEIEGIHEYIKYREYKRLKKDNLTYPNGKILRLYSDSAHIIHNFLNSECHKNNIKKKLKLIIVKRCDMSWLGCEIHRNIKQYFVNLVIRLHVHNWCNIINKILNGKVEEKYISKMHTIHVTAFKKYKSYKLRQKATKNNE